MAPENKQNHGRIVGFCMLLFLAALAISFLVPIAMPVVAIVFIGSGVKMSEILMEVQCVALKYLSS